MVQFVIVNVPSLEIPPPRPVLTIPSLMVKPDKLTVAPGAVSNTRLAWLPLMASSDAADPVIVRFRPI
jgi:hypothetical protein